MGPLAGFIAFVWFVLDRGWRDEDQLCANCRRYYHKCTCAPGWWELP